MMSLPTHLEIGLLPPTTVSLEEAQRRAEAERNTENSSDSLASRDANSGQLREHNVILCSEPPSIILPTELCPYVY